MTLDNLIGKGLERARQFSWERSAQAVWDVLEANA